ncbi:NAD-dependent epimerase/dehydratase family protein [Microvirga lotononidis]|uniref:Nucleoside-diphosphate-sugar epimerase n=1 Tax=Microvirga lotononidis TaxID=864069 RepID=I4Z2Q8_9HYPH|nr:NAD(P)-dependent oxidoreductase [Microvirga lotononidis]EIM30500.1 nucleoside-diphosphate-sugar epimerase [Microvirga lotononidis]WQO26336.1 NAD(P)-dependent oxidoreductase [Microvirga lotononidis]
MKRVLVTGGSGKTGRACVRDLLEHGYEVINVDAIGPGEALCPFVEADLTDFGEALEALSEVDSRHKGVDAVVHLAAIPAPGRHTNAVTFRNNILSTYNVFEAARKLAIRNLVWASSETVLGLPFDERPPYAPLDEDYPARPETAYSLSKFLGEEMAQQFCRWDPDLKIIGLRFSNVMEPADYARFASFEADPQSRKWNLWGYIDARDAAQAVRKALEASLKGAEVFIIANADTVMTRPNSELMAEFYPDVAFTREVEPNETLLSIGKARRLLGYEPRYGWRTASSS